MTSEQLSAILAELKHKMTVCEKRIADLESNEKELTQLTLIVKEITINVKNMVDEQKAQRQRLDILEKIPTQKWHGVGEQAIKSIVSVITTALTIGLVLLIANYIK